MTTVDTASRDSREEWQPDELPHAVPVWAWPPRPLKALKWFFTYPGFLFPWNAFFFLIALGTWAYLTPELSRMVEFRIDWIAEIYFRNLVLLVVWTGGLHVWLYTFRAQGSEYKFNPKWLNDEKSPVFTWGSQLRDNAFWSIASGCTVWTAYEVVLMWGYANGFIAWVDWKTEPVTFAIMVLLIPFWRDLHFYLIHRAIHWKPLYRTVHYLHHKNVNPGPWSGISMHPVEHFIYFSVALLFWIVPSHPLMVIFVLQHAVLVANMGHSGFEEYVVRGKAKLPTGQFNHYQHHRYFECNYGSQLVPLDTWFGSFHDGSPEAHARMVEKWSKKRDPHIVGH